MKKLILLALLPILLVGCKEEEVEFGTLFTTNAVEWFDWVVVSDSKGKVLNYKQVTQEGEVIRLSGGTNDESVSVTFVMPGRNGYAFRLKTYHDIPRNSNFTFDGSANLEIEEREAIGSCTVTIDDFNDGLDGFYSFIFNDGYSQSFYNIDRSSVIYENGQYTATVFLYQDESDLLISSYKEGKPVYYDLNGVLPDDEITISYGDFKSMTPVSMTLPELHGSIAGLYDASFSRVDELSDLTPWSNSQSSSNSDHQELGYVSGYPFYAVTLAGSVSSSSDYNHNIYYQSIVENLSSEIVVNGFSSDVANTAFDRFSVSIDQAYSYAEVDFRYSEAGDYFVWSFITPKGSQIQPIAIPDEIVDSYAPLGDIDKIEFAYAQFVKLDESETYIGRVEELITEKSRGTFTDVRYSVWPKIQ